MRLPKIGVDRRRESLQKEITGQAEFAAKVVSAQIFPAIAIVCQLLVLWLSRKGSLFPGEEELKSIVSVCAQIIAGLYGVTLASYTFFLSRMDGLAASDNTLDYVVDIVKRRFKYQIWFITYNVLITLVISIVLMYCSAPTQSDHAFFYRLICNEFVVSLAFSIVLILWYSLNVIAPNCLEKEAAKQKKKLSHSANHAGSAVEFISMYERIEARCNEMVPENVLHQIQENKGKHFEYTIELLQEQGIFNQPLIQDLKRIHRYYECTVNCTPLSVSQEMCVLSQKVLTYLDSVVEKLKIEQ